MNHGQHGGDIYRNEILYDFSININPLGMPDAVRRVLRDSIDTWEQYPDPECEALTACLAEYYRVPASWLICGSGAADLIYQLMAFLKPGQALLTAPAFSEYERALRAVGCRITYENLKKEEEFALVPERMAAQIDGSTDIVFVCNPNNPTGMMVDGEALCCLAEACERNHAVLVVDECFCELSDRPEKGSFLPWLDRYPRTVILRAFTKTYAMAGLRLGYGICSSPELLDGLRQVRQPWSISVPAQQAGAAALGQREYLRQARAMIRQERERLKKGLEQLGFRVYPSEANYLLFEDTLEEGTLWHQMKTRKLLIRDCSNYRNLGSGFCRVCVRTPEENQILLQYLHEILAERKRRS